MQYTIVFKLYIESIHFGPCSTWCKRILLSCCQLRNTIKDFGPFQHCYCYVVIVHCEPQSCDCYISLSLPIRRTVCNLKPLPRAWQLTTTVIDQKGDWDLALFKMCILAFFPPLFRFTRLLRSPEIYVYTDQIVVQYLWYSSYLHWSLI